MFLDRHLHNGGNSRHTGAPAGRDWAWRRNDVAPPKNQTTQPSADVGQGDAVSERLVAQLLRLGGEELVARLSRLSARLDKAKPPPIEISGQAVVEWASRNRENEEDPNRAIFIDGDPEVWRADGRRLTDSEREYLFGNSLPSPGSASHPDFYLPFGSVVVIPRGEGAYIRGRGWRVSLDRHLQAWSWGCEPNRVLPIGGFEESVSASEGQPNYSPVPLHEGVFHRGMKFWNRDASGVLPDETLYEHEDRRARMRQQMGSLMRDAQDHYGFANWASPPGWSMSGKPMSANLPRDEGEDPSGIVTEAVGWAPGVPPELWRFYFWTMTGGYMVADDWRLGDGMWRWPGGLSPDRSMPVRDTLTFRAGPDSCNPEWTKPAFNHQWLFGKLPIVLFGSPFIASLPGFAGSGLARLRRTGGPFLATWANHVPELMDKIDQSTPRADENQSSKRRAFETLKATAFGGSMADYFAAADRKVAFDKEQNAAMAAEIAEHRLWMENNCDIAYIPNPTGIGPLDGPDAKIIKERWRWDFAPEPMIAPKEFNIPTEENNGAHNSAPGEVSVSAPTATRAVIFPGETGPDDYPSLRRRDAEAQNMSLEELDAQQKAIMARAEALIFGSPAANKGPPDRSEG